MAIIVKAEITITKGFNTWKSMVKKNQDRMEEMGMVMLFAGVKKDEPTKLHAIMKFPDLEALQAFGANEQQSATECIELVPWIDSGIMTIIADDECNCKLSHLMNYKSFLESGGDY